jgi:hypothetical protein
MRKSHASCETFYIPFAPFCKNWRLAEKNTKKANFFLIGTLNNPPVRMSGYVLGIRGAHPAASPDQVLRTGEASLAA